MDTTDQQAVTVAQIDREAANKLHADYACLLRTCERQDVIGLFAKSFARHRLASVSSASAELEAGKDELRRLMDSIWRAEYRKEAPDWSPLDDLPGMVSQIDNMYAGVRGQRDQARWDLYNPPASPEPVPATNQAGEVEPRLRMFLEILAASGGQQDASDTRWNWINAFCGEHEGRDPDTFNLAEQRGYTTVSHNTDTDEGMVYLTASGRAYLATQPATSQEGEIFRLAANLVYRIEAAGALEYEGMNFERWKTTARSLAPSLRAAIAATPTPPTLSEDLRETIEQAVSVLERLPYGDWPGPMYSGKTVAANALIRSLRAALAQESAS